ISVKFANKTCRDCEGCSLCTKAKTAPRHMTLRPQPEHQVLQAVQQQQSAAAWKAHYDKRAGIEGTLSQGLRAFGLRQCRYRGLPKTRLQHLAIAAAITINWLRVLPFLLTSCSL